ncbi:MAG: hypothetical protein IJW10_02935 [Clostridia bacterium]|nr:hypothetical protein [Clostridia bacterium]
MEILRKILFRITHIGLWLTVLGILVSAVLVFVTIVFNVSTGLHIFTAILVVFTVINILVPLPDHVYKVKAIIHKNKIATRYVYDYEYRSNIVMQIGFLGNTAYALINLFLGLITRQVWFVSIGVFYTIFGFLKFALLVKQAHLLKSENMRERKATALRVWRFFGASMFIITIPTTIMVAQMIYNNKSYYYGPIITFGYFIYTSIYLIAAIVKVFQARMRRNPIFTAYSNMSFCGALMSVLALQTALINVFGLNDSLRRTINTFTGALVIAIFYAISIVVIVSTTIQLRRNYPELSTYSKHKEYKAHSGSIFDRTLEYDTLSYTGSRIDNS